MSKWIEEVGRQGVGIFSLLRNHPFDRDFRIETGTNLYEGVPSWHKAVGPGVARQDRLAMLARPWRP